MTGYSANSNQTVSRHFPFRDAAGCRVTELAGDRVGGLIGRKADNNVGITVTPMDGIAYAQLPDVFAGPNGACTLRIDKHRCRSFLFFSFFGRMQDFPPLSGADWRGAGSGQQRNGESVSIAQNVIVRTCVNGITARVRQIGGTMGRKLFLGSA